MLLLVPVLLLLLLVETTTSFASAVKVSGCVMRHVACGFVGRGQGIVCMPTTPQLQLRGGR